MAKTLQDYGIQFNSLPIFEKLVYEAPVNLGGDNCFFGDCSIGAFSCLQNRCEFTHTTIGRYCSLASQVCAGPGQHFTHNLTTHPFIWDPEDQSARLGQFESYRKIMGRRPFSRPATIPRAMSAPGIRIGHDVWIGTRVIIMGGVTIGDGAVLAAGAIVTKDVAPYSVVAGVPAREVKKRFAPDLIEKLLELQWWNYDMAHVSNQVDFGQVEAVVEFMNDRIKAGTLPEFTPDKFEAKRQGGNVIITKQEPVLVPS